MPVSRVRRKVPPPPPAAPPRLNALGRRVVLPEPEAPRRLNALGRRVAPPEPDAPRRPYSNGKRIRYGVMWGFYTLLLAIFAIVGFAIGSVGLGFLLLVITGISARYTYRLWTWQAKHFIFIIPL